MVKRIEASAAIAKHKVLPPPVRNTTKVSLFSKNEHIASYCPSRKFENPNTWLSI